MRSRKLLYIVSVLVLLYLIFPIKIEIQKSDFYRYNISLSSFLLKHKFLFSFDSSFNLVRKVKGADNKFEGKQYWKYDTGESLVAMYSNGYKNGLARDLYSDGNLYSESVYTNDKLDGYKYFYWPDGKRKAINLFDADSLVYYKIYQRDSLKNIIDSMESYFPIVKITGQNKLNDTISFSFVLSRHLAELKSKQVEIKYDLDGFDTDIQKFPYPQLSAVFNSDTLKFKYQLLKKKRFLYLYGWLLAKDKNGKVQEYEGFNYLIQ